MRATPTKITIEAFIRNTVRGKVKEVDKVYFSNKEAAAYLGVTIEFLKTLRENALISFYKVRNTVFYKKTELDRMIERNKII